MIHSSRLSILAVSRFQWKGGVLQLAGLLFVLCAVVLQPARAADPTSWKYAFGPGKAPPGYTQVTPASAYSDSAGFGFEPGSTVTATSRGGDDPLTGGFVTSDKPFYFSIKLAPGNYNVTVTLGDLNDVSATTVKAELRRLMLYHVETAKGETVTRTFTVNVRTPAIVGGGQVKLKARETTSEAWAWDDKLTLEFNDTRPCLCALQIDKVNVPTLFILGDSTVCDQPLEPWNSWGQMLPRFLKPGIAVSNQAESGESLTSSLGAGRVNKVLGDMKPGDYLLIQYGHNDQKGKPPGYAMGTYKDDFEKRFIEPFKAKGGHVLVVTSMLRKIDATGPGDSLKDYPAAARLAASEEGVPLIDLNAMSKLFYTALGANVAAAFCNHLNPATNTMQTDGTHHGNYGSYELAKCVIEGIRNSKLDLAKFIVDDEPVFDPSKPDPVATFVMPASVAVGTTKPEGN
jgi:lysophospholipase L1-like esterase